MHLSLPPCSPTRAEGRLGGAAAGAVSGSERRNSELKLIGCTILRAVSGILRTQRGRRGSGPGRQLPGALRLFYSPSRLNYRPVAGLSAPVALLSPVAHHCLSSPPWLSSSPLWLNSLSPGRRRRLATSHLPWAYSLGCSRACQIKPDRIATVVVIGVQWGGLGLGTVCGWFAVAS